MVDTLELIRDFATICNDALKPCPHCGGRAKIKTDERWSRCCIDVYAECQNAVCGSRTGANSAKIWRDAFESIVAAAADVIERWNQRTADDGGEDSGS